MTKIAILGCGSVGSTLGEALTRLGHSVRYLVDRDVVESKNKAKSVYTEEDVGMSKVNALSQHLMKINRNMKITTICKFMEELTDEEWKALLDKTEIILEMADSRRGSETCVQKVREYYEKTTNQRLVIKMICLDNLAAGFTVVWTPGSGNPCPCCLFKITPLMNTSDERTERNNADYTYDKITGYAVQGVLPDLLFGIALTSSLVHGMILELESVESGRKSVLAPFVTGANSQCWNPFRDAFFDWQKESHEPVMGSVRPLSLNTDSPCPFCGLNMEERKEVA